MNNTDVEGYNGQHYLAMVGADFKPMDNVVLGVGVGYENTSLSMDNSRGNFSSAGLVVTPYLGVNIFEGLVWDAMGSFSFLANSERSKNYSALRAMFATNLSYTYFIDNLGLTADVGYMYSSESGDKYTSYVSEFKFGGQVSYLVADKFEPYIGLHYIYDAAMSKTGFNSNDPDEIEGTLGFNVYATDNFTLSAEVAQNFDRRHQSDTRAMINLKYVF